MADVNIITIGGRLMGQPSISYSAGGGNSSNGNGDSGAVVGNGRVKIARLTVACHRSVRDQSQPTGWAEITDRMPVVCFGRVADRAERLGTGAYVTVSGRFQTYEYGRTATTPNGDTTISIPVTGFEVVATELNQIVAGRERERERERSQTEADPRNLSLAHQDDLAWLTRG